ncbi:MAG TPA: DNA repair protein RecN, partial [Rhodothermales bacterium]|nr:DNA repair protein RecN [Rhodothermales bacterium]
ISRIMLALKTILAKNERLPILVFDEIDTGISGRIAGKVGEAMRNLGEYHQIIAITHLPQIAAQGHNHYVVEKLVSEDRTRSQIRLLSTEERIRTIAAMFSGDEITEAALESARALLKHA